MIPPEKTYPNITLQATQFHWTNTPNGKRGYAEISDLRLNHWYSKILIKGKKETLEFKIQNETNPDKLDQGRYYNCTKYNNLQVFIAND